MDDDNGVDITVGQALLAFFIAGFAGVLYALSRLGWIVLVLLLALPAVADAAPFYKRSSFWWKTSLVCLGGAHGADIASTMTVLALKRGYETNILLASVRDPTKAGALKGGLAVGSVLLSKELHERKPKTATLLNFAACGGLGYVANRNAQLYRGTR